ncbi:MAG: 4Fe-4S cluster-binding domain-containing protein [Chloroflexi bacterium]|nr:MAG: 4Fe-4S cluster-binding domain-containing protein [Chloroflexota bacterium]
MDTLRISQIQHSSFAEGPRCNTTVWLAGCSIRCPGCFNPELWNPDAGHPEGIQALLNSISEGIAKGDNGLALVGGEPFDQVAGLTALLTAFNDAFPEVPVTLYSGYSIETLLAVDENRTLLDLADVLVDGPFLLEREQEDLGYRGSRNQRVIDLVRSRASRYTELHLHNWDNLIAFLPDGSLAGAAPMLSMFAVDEAAECGLHMNPKEGV